MKFRPSRNKGVLLVMAIGMMVMVEFMTVHQLDSVKMTFALRKQYDYQQLADLAARSGLDYGYTMVKNTMESMSLVDIRFATHLHKSTGNVADVPPAWQEIINPVFDKKARDKVGAEINWVGTDSFDMGVKFPPGPSFPFDAGFADINVASINPSILNTIPYTDPDGNTKTANTITETDGLAECAREELDASGNWNTYHDSTYSDLECRNVASLPPYNRPPGLGFPSIYPSLEAFENNSKRDGHFGTKRWHYYDAWNFTNIGGDNIPSDTAASTPRGTGGMIRFDPKDLSDFAANRHLFFDRLFNYKRDDDTLQFPYEPLRTTGAAAEIDTPEERDATQDSYQVQMFTSLNLDELDPSSPDDEASFDHTDYTNVSYKVFFKLWITRDEKRDGYAGNLQVNPGQVTESFIPGVTLKDYSGTDIVANSDTGIAWDLHPIWSISRPTPTDNSFWRENYLKDFMDTDAKDGLSLASGKDHRLGVLQFPVPYLAYQRGDKDYWVDSIRGTSAVSSPSGDDGLPLDHPHYTRFTLWSLGTVREVNQDNLGRKVAENDQRIDHFEIVSRALYKLVFYMDTRAVEVNDEDQLTQGQDNIFLSTLGCDANKKNMNNTSAFNALYIPACDVDPAGKAISLYEPLGIYLDSTEKVDYLDSRK